MDHRKSDTEARKITVITFLAVFIVTLTVYFLTREGIPTSHNHFVHLADAFLNGRLYLTENISWLELAPFEGKYFVVPPPLPAILILPVVAIFGLSTDQTLVSIFFGSINVSLAFLAARAITKSRSVQLWTTAMFGFGTIHWWAVTEGGVWTFSQTVSVTFLFIAILLTLNNYHPFSSGSALGASYWCRLTTILSFPFFLTMYSGRWLGKERATSIINRIDLKPVLWLGLGAVVFVALNAVYNLLRFNTPFDISYYLIPGALDEPWYREGIFDVSYIPRHLKVLFLGFPRLTTEEFPYITPSWNGMAIWITTPAFVYAFLAGIRNKIAIGCWLSIIPIALVNFSHGAWGFEQFGYRFALDFYPFLFLLTVKGIGDDVKWHHKALIVTGILVNLWGVIWINKFGWVGF